MMLPGGSKVLKSGRDGGNEPTPPDPQSVTTEWPVGGPPENVQLGRTVAHACDGLEDKRILLNGQARDLTDACFAIFTVGTGLGPVLMAVSFDETRSYAIALAVSASRLGYAGVLVSRPGRYNFPARGQARRQR